MNALDSVHDYIVKAKTIASKIASIGYSIESRELIYHVVQGIYRKLERIAIVLRVTAITSIDEVYRTLRKKKKEE